MRSKLPNTLPIQKVVKIAIGRGSGSSAIMDENIVTIRENIEHIPKTKEVYLIGKYSEVAR